LENKATLTFIVGIYIIILFNFSIKTVSNLLFGVQTNENSISKSDIIPTKKITNFEDNKNDTIPPIINITYPSYPPTISLGKFIIHLVVQDFSGIKNISASVHSFPFKGKFPIDLPVLPSNIRGNYFIPFNIHNTGTYRIVIEAWDNAENPSYKEIMINAPIPNQNSTFAIFEKNTPKVAFIRPTFTEAAYQEHGFYTFYNKYGFPSSDKNITTDLDMLTVKPAKSVTEDLGADQLRNLDNLTSLVPVNGTNLDDISFEGYPDPQPFWMPFIQHVKNALPDSVVTVMRDEDVDDNHIFYSDNKTNAYDLLLFFHNEYVTQKEYDNLRLFVQNGGHIIFIDANVLYAEVHHDKDNNQITLVKGHDFQYNGTVAKSSVSERWFNETKDWVGGNYQPFFISHKVNFTNNVFNYTHLEEEYVNNPKDKIIIDYGIKYPAEDVKLNPELGNRTVATYSLDYGKGQVIMIGLFGETLANNKLFLKLFESLITNQIFCSKNINCK
jgi:hypothetical protein